MNAQERNESRKGTEMRRKKTGGKGKDRMRKERENGEKGKGNH